MRAFAVLLLAAMAFAAPFDQAVAALSNFTAVLNEAFSSPVPQIKAMSAYFLNLSYAQGLMEGVKELRHCYGAFQEVATALDTYINTKIISPANATMMLGELKAYLGCAKFYLEQVKQVKNIVDI